MTGKPNYVNYEYFTYLNTDEKTFGNLFQENGYKTALAGKWQLNGVQFDLDNNQDLDRPYKFGFDEYCLWWLRERGDRFANPNIVQNGVKLKKSIDDYGPDIFTDFIIEFIHKNKDDLEGVAAAHGRCNRQGKRRDAGADQGGESPELQPGTASRGKAASPLQEPAK